MKKIAIVGAGFSGLGLCYHLLQIPGEKQVVVFDGKGIGGGASGIASGLLHPFPGESGKLSWKGREGIAATLQLLKAVGKSAYKETGILRLAMSAKQQKLFQERADQEEDVEWWGPEQCRSYVPGGHYLPGMFIRSGITVHAASYLSKLWKICENLGAKLVLKQVSLKNLEDFDQVVLATGGGVKAFNLGLDLKLNKGQILVCQKPKYWTQESSLIGKGYLALSEKEDECYLGSTYEHDFITPDPCLGTATHLILKQIGQFIPSYSSFHVRDCLAEIRVANRKGYRPIVQEVKPGVFVMTAMGSRGLLYHSYLGRILAEAMLQRKPILEEVG